MGRNCVQRKVKALRLKEAGLDHNEAGQAHPPSAVHHYRQVDERPPVPAPGIAKAVSESLEDQLRARLKAEIRAEILAELAANCVVIEGFDDE